MQLIFRKERGKLNEVSIDMSGHHLVTNVLSTPILLFQQIMCDDVIIVLYCIIYSSYHINRIVYYLYSFKTKLSTIVKEASRNGSQLVKRENDVLLLFPISYV